MRFTRPFWPCSSQSYPQNDGTIPSAIIKTETRSRKIDFVKHHTSRRLAHLAFDPLLHFCTRYHFRAHLCFANVQSAASKRANQSHRQHTTRLPLRCKPSRIGPNGFRWTHFCSGPSDIGAQSLRQSPRRARKHGNGRTTGGTRT